MFCKPFPLGSARTASLTLSAAVDGLTGAIYCHQCEDFVYAEIIDTWRNRALRTMEERSDISRDGMCFLKRCGCGADGRKRTWEEGKVQGVETDARGKSCNRTKRPNTMSLYVPFLAPRTTD
jgi:hypothetical protein